MIFAVNVVEVILIKEDKEVIDMVIVGIEFSIDELKVVVVVLYCLMGI